MTTETEAPLPDLLDGLDPEALTRGFCLACAVMSCGPAGAAHTLAVAASYYDFVDPFAMSEEETKFKLKLEPKA